MKAEYRVQRWGANLDSIGPNLAHAENKEGWETIAVIPIDLASSQGIGGYKILQRRKVA